MHAHTHTHAHTRTHTHTHTQVHTLALRDALTSSTVSSSLVPPDNLWTSEREEARILQHRQTDRQTRYTQRSHYT